MKSKDKAEKFKNLTDSDIRSWAGSTIFRRGMSYHLEGLVSEISVLSDGSLTTEVEGTDTYEVFVDIDENGLSAECTCPYDYSPCKHAAAAVLEYRDMIKQGLEVNLEIDLEFCLRDEDNDSVENPVSVNGDGKEIRENKDLVRAYLESLNKENLIKMIEEIALNDRDLSDKLKRSGQLMNGDVGKVIKSAKKKLKKLTREPAYVHYWSGERNIPDYSSFSDELNQLLESGHIDEVMDLGEDLFRESQEQIEEADDEGETHAEIETCMEVFFDALGRSSLSVEDQVEKIFELMEEDEFDVIFNSAPTYFDGDFKPKKWSKIADLLIEKLNHLNKNISYYRDGIMDWLTISLDGAGRGKEVIPFLESETKDEDDFVRLARRFIIENRLDEAIDRIFKGLDYEIDQSGTRGTSSSNDLKKLLAEVYLKKGDRVSFASVQADFFFQSPYFNSYKEIIKLSEELSVREKVRDYILNYLKIGEVPFGKSGWPLPDVGLRKYFTISNKTFPQFDILIQIALLENRNDDAVNLYDEKKKNSLFGYGMDDEIADAVKETHPKKSVEIWKKLAKAEIEHQGRNHYKAAKVYLIKIRSVLKKHGFENEWKKYIESLRAEHKRKRTFIEIVCEI